ncbi:copper resistance D family protein [Bacillus horti]|uniref:Copper resistance protein D n=1 Tax=Caldalkalibacillus horti TaxID=77523 RepID=A0ABT9VX10_9BACI|nr:CopD family protein [Bacillus horti]MDQ0165532.1 putative copper resistance protein D [Bacillus horti]
MVIISEGLLYVAFSVLFGTLIFHLIPDSRKPDILVPKIVLLLSVVGVVLLSFAPVLKIIINLARNYDLWLIIDSVLTSFDIGKAWIFTATLGTLLFLMFFFVDLKKQKPFIYLALFLVLLLAGAQGWASHAKTIAGWQGFFAHSGHFLFVCIWIGILFVAGWFAKNQQNWIKFLNWFSPVAMASVLMVGLTGFWMMGMSLEPQDYTTAWVLPYGQALLLKHILILPLLVFAFINGFIIRGKLKSSDEYSPIPWTRAESVIVLLIFTATAALGQQAQPHTISRTLDFIEPSILFQWFYSGAIESSIRVTPSFGLASIVLLALSVLLLLLTVILFKKSAKTWYTIGTSVLFVITTYLALMIGV